VPNAGCTRNTARGVAASLSGAVAEHRTNDERGLAPPSGRPWRGLISGAGEDVTFTHAGVTYRAGELK
jgi:hypothetical protein